MALKKVGGSGNYNNSKPVIIDIPRWPPPDALKSLRKSQGEGAIKYNGSNAVIFNMPRQLSRAYSKDALGREPAATYLFILLRPHRIDIERVLCFAVSR
jgi:hypothetical protein